MDIPSCQCGDDGRYQNMICGQFIWTCGKRGCLKINILGQSASSGTGGGVQMSPSQNEITQLWDYVNRLEDRIKTLEYPIDH